MPQIEALSIFALSNARPVRISILAFWLLLSLSEPQFSPLINKANNPLGCWRLKCMLASAAAAKSLQSCPTLGDPIDSSSPGSTVPGILQARTLEWVAISLSSA